MGQHLGDSVGGWEWDSVLLLASPAFDAASTLEQSGGGGFGVGGESWTGLNSPSLSEGKTSSIELFRDPRLDCPNFLAGRVPCACTDEDNDDEGGSRGTKRAKVSARCQVPACGADLARLKGYHQRHRVCLQCANSTTVVLRDIAHRYCQQCGKFHVLGDFDEGKRSCRFKLKRHNNRRRRKVQDSGEDAASPAGENDKASLITGEAGVNGDENSAVESKAQPEVGQSVVVQVSKEVSSPVEQSDTTDATRVLSAGAVDGPESKPDGAQEALSAPTIKQHGTSDVPVNAESAPLWSSQEKVGGTSNGHKSGVDEDSLLALLLEDSANVNESLPPHGFESASPVPSRFQQTNKPNAYTSSCPTGRISFKLYDWNPGDFPRNLRQQILEWLSNMPVDLEGYIRSGCTILTLFISMPQSMWKELNADWESAVARLVCSPLNTSGFWEKGYFKAKLGRQTVHVENGKVVNRSGGKEDCMPCMPVLHSVEPVCFRAGIGCMLNITGRNLLQKDTKLLMSHGGKYIPAWILNASSESKTEDKWQVVVPPLDIRQAGPVFIEVENEGRPSNMMVVVVGDGEFCNEVESLELCTSSCEAQDLLYDMGWVMKEATLDSHVLTQRLQSLLSYANAKGWERVAERILEAADRRGVSHKLVGAADRYSLNWSNIEVGSIGYEHQSYKPLPFAAPDSTRSHLIPSSAQSETDEDKHTHIITCSSSSEDLMTASLLPQRGMRAGRRSPWGGHPYRLAFAVASATAACAGLCVVLQHPEQVAVFSTSLRRCLWSD